MVVCCMSAESKRFSEPLDVLCQWYRVLHCGWTHEQYSELKIQMYKKLVPQSPSSHMARFWGTGRKICVLLFEVIHVYMYIVQYSKASN